MDFQRTKSLCCWPCVTIRGWWWRPLTVSSVWGGGSIQKNTVFILLLLLWFYRKIQICIFWQTKTPWHHLFSSLMCLCIYPRKQGGNKHPSKCRRLCFGNRFSGISSLICFDNGGTTAALVHVETGWRTLLSQEEHPICVLRSQMKLCMRVLALWTCSFFSGSRVYICIRRHLEYDEEKILCLYAQISAQSIGQVFPRMRPVLLIGHTMHTHRQTHTHTHTQTHA